MAAFRLTERRQARGRDKNSGFWLVVSGRPVPVKECSRHWVTVENQSPWPSAKADATCLIQAQECLIFESPHEHNFATIVFGEVLRKHSPIDKYLDMLRRPPGGRKISICTTASFQIDDPMLSPINPEGAFKVVVGTRIRVK